MYSVRHNFLYLTVAQGQLINIRALRKQRYDQRYRFALVERGLHNIYAVDFNVFFINKWI